MHEDKKSVLEEAIDKVCGDRHDDYGDATLNHTRTAALWNVWITNRRWAGQPLTAYDVAMMMNLTKSSISQSVLGCGSMDGEHQIGS